jgi:drug/metabolite transporter (DMT)-like permease
MNSRVKAIVQALFVVFLWATSWVFIKIGLQDIPPLTFAGLRYVIAFVCLLIVLFFNKSKSEISSLTIKKWGIFILLGFLFYAATQGASFVALYYLPAVTVNLIWSFSSVVVALLGIVWLAEKPTRFQWIGIILALFGAVVYFYPVTIPKAQYIGVIVAIVGVGANALSSVLGRSINRLKEHHPLVVTVISMGAGSILLLGVGIYTEGIPVIDIKGWGIILWLAIVNTAFAFTLWNHTLRTLSAVESSVINSTMLIWIPLFAVAIMGETVTPKAIIGLVIVGIGSLIVQVRRLSAIKSESS